MSTHSFNVRHCLSTNLMSSNIELFAARCCSRSTKFTHTLFFLLCTSWMLRNTELDVDRCCFRAMRDAFSSMKKSHSTEPKENTFYREAYIGLCEMLALRLFLIMRRRTHDMRRRRIHELMRDASAKAISHRRRRIHHMRRRIHELMRGASAIYIYIYCKLSMLM